MATWANMDDVFGHRGSFHWTLGRDNVVFSREETSMAADWHGTKSSCSTYAVGTLPSHYHTQVCSRKPFYVANT